MNRRRAYEPLDARAVQRITENIARTRRLLAQEDQDLRFSQQEIKEQKQKLWEKKQKKYKDAYEQHMERKQKVRRKRDFWVMFI